MVAVSSPEPIRTMVPFADMFSENPREWEIGLRFKVDRLKDTAAQDSFRALLISRIILGG
jgi:hypothetical protein